MDTQSQIWGGLMLGLLITLLIGIPLGSIIAIIWASRKDILFTVALEGTAKLIVLNGKLVKIVMTYTDHYLDEHGNIVRKETKDTTTGRSREKKDGSFLEKRFLGGIHWIGFFTKPLRYRQRWISIEQGKNGDELIEKNEELDFVLLKDDVYFVKISKAETKDELPVDIGVAITARIENPEKAILRGQHWLEIVENQISSEVREFIGRMTYTQLNEKEASAKAFMEELQGRLNGLREQYGVLVSQVQIKTVDLDGRFVEASVKNYLGEQEALRIEKEAVGKAKAIGIIAKAEKERIQAIYDSVPSDKKELYIMDKVAESSLIAFGGGTMLNIGVGDQPKKKKEK